MEKLLFVDNKNIQQVTHHDKDCSNDNYYDDYNTPDSNRVDETTFTTPNSADKKATSTLQLRQKTKWNKLAALYRYLHVTGNLSLVNTDWLQRKTLKAGNTTLLFFDSRNWQSFTIECAGELLAPNSLEHIFGGVHVMRTVLNLNKTSPAGKWCFKV